MTKTGSSDGQQQELLPPGNGRSLNDLLDSNDMVTARGVVQFADLRSLRRCSPLRREGARGLFPL